MSAESEAEVGLSSYIHRLIKDEAIGSRNLMCRNVSHWHYHGCDVLKLMIPLHAKAWFWEM
jgi:hypothetical protein